MDEAYREYLQSEEWKTLREKQLQKDHRRCCICGATTDLNVHHITYANMESPPLITLCKSCHENVHKHLDEYRKELDSLNVEIEEKFIPLAVEYNQKKIAITAKYMKIVEKTPKPLSNAGKVCQAFWLCAKKPPCFRSGLGETHSGESYNAAIKSYKEAQK